MTTHVDGKSAVLARSRCEECAAPLAADQRYCVECGARRSPLTRSVALLLGVSQEGVLSDVDKVDGQLAHVEAFTEEPEDPPPSDGVSMPTPRAAAVAVMTLLAFGVLVGSALSPVGQSQAASPLVVAVSPPPRAASAPPTPIAPPSSAAQAAPAPAPTPVVTPAAPTIVTQAAPPPVPSAGLTPTTAPTVGLPPITHVFLIVLSSQGFDAAFGPASPAAYLSKRLRKRGELLENYYGVTGGELANELALISGQGPTEQTAANCPTYADVTPGTPGANGQVSGNGCVYPHQTLTLADQLVDAGRTWKAYVEDVQNGGAGQPPTCRHPALGSNDPLQAPTPKDAYVTWRNPFVYFHSIIDTPGCAQNDVGLNQLASDLKVARRSPSFAYIVPSRCHDGSDQPCAPGQPAGLASADAFLAKVVPQIESSAAYKGGGLIAITFDQAPQSGPQADSGGCCNMPAYPNVPAAPGGSTSGGSTGAPGGNTTSGTTSSGTTPGVTTPTVTPPTVSTARGTTPSGTTSSGTTSGTSPSGTTPSGTTTSGITPTGATSSPGGGRVGMLLLSRYVKPDSTNLILDYNHFSLLRTVEDIFSLQHLGYAGAAGLLPFDQSVFNGRP